MLYKLAETMVIIDDLLTMVALRKPAQAGYSNLMRWTVHRIAPSGPSPGWG
jgi:hypothetical protein